MVDRLTDEELAYLERAIADPGPSDFAGVATWLAALVAEVRAARELFEDLEWASSEYPEGVSACPICLALSDKAEPYGFAQSDGNHKPGCKLAALLGREGKP